MRRSRGSAGGNRGAGAHRTGPCQGRCPPHVQEALPMSVPRPARPRHLVATVAATLLFAACSYGAGGVSSASSGPVTPAPAASAGGGGYGGGYGGGGDDYGTNPPASPAASEGAGSNVLAIAESPTLGTFLVGQGGRTLYTFDRDTATASACSGGCAPARPPPLLRGAQAAPPGAGARR